jgi:hypothetical protein
VEGHREAHLYVDRVTAAAGVPKLVDAECDAAKVGESPGAEEQRTGAGCEKRENPAHSKNVTLRGSLLFSHRVKLE